MKLDGTEVWITGGASGLGLACAERFCLLGSKVTIFDFDNLRAQKEAKRLGIKAHQIDVSDEISVASAVSEASTNSVRPRVLINCAGIGVAARIVDKNKKLSTNVFQRVIGVNLIGTYLMMSHVVRLMLETDPATEIEERGVVINTSSVAYQDGQVGQMAYSASKGGVASLCLPAARELGPFGIRVITIAPGLFETPMTETLPYQVKSELEQNIPFPSRLGLGQEYALLAQQIIENKYLNGTTIRLDGGLRLLRK